jgi:hypothetical protein
VFLVHVQTLHEQWQGTAVYTFIQAIDRQVFGPRHVKAVEEVKKISTCANKELPTTCSFKQLIVRLLAQGT